MAPSKAVCLGVCDHLERMKEKLVTFVTSMFVAIPFLTSEKAWFRRSGHNFSPPFVRLSYLSITTVILLPISSPPESRRRGSMKY